MSELQKLPHLSEYQMSRYIPAFEQPKKNSQQHNLTIQKAPDYQDRLSVNICLYPDIYVYNSHQFRITKAEYYAPKELLQFVLL